MKEPGLTFNPTAGMDLHSVRVAFIKNDVNKEKAGDQTEAISSPLMTMQQAMTNGFYYDKHHETIGIVALLWEFRFKVRGPTRFADNEVVVMKRTGFRDLGEEETQAIFARMWEQEPKDSPWSRLRDKVRQGR